MRAALLLSLLSMFQDRPPVPPKKPGTPEALFDLLNQEREKEKLPKLKSSPLLVKLAQAHADNMAKQEKMAHKLDDKGVKERADDAGYDYRSIGENVAYAGAEDPRTPEPKPADIHANWMKSKAHRDNIVSPKFTEVGLAIARSKKGNYYYAQVFGRPAK